MNIILADEIATGNYFCCEIPRLVHDKFYSSAVFMTKNGTILQNMTNIAALVK